MPSFFSVLCITSHVFSHLFIHAPTHTLTSFFIRYLSPYSSFTPCVMHSFTYSFLLHLCAYCLNVSFIHVLSPYRVPTICHAQCADLVELTIPQGREILTDVKKSPSQPEGVVTNAGAVRGVWPVRKAQRSPLSRLGV